MFFCNIVVEGRWSGSSSPLLRLHKKIESTEDKMFRVTNYYVWLKCYLNICVTSICGITNVRIVADKMRCNTFVANAINKFYTTFNKKINKIYSFLRVITISLFSAFTDHNNLFPLLNSKRPTISEGIVVLNDFEFGFCCITLDLTSNNFIHSFLSFVINIFDNNLYIFYLLSFKK